MDQKEKSIVALTAWYESVLADIKKSENVVLNETIGSAVGLNIETDQKSYYITAKIK